MYTNLMYIIFVLIGVSTIFFIKQETPGRVFIPYVSVLGVLLSIISLIILFINNHL